MLEADLGIEEVDGGDGFHVGRQVVEVSFSEPAGIVSIVDVPIETLPV